MLEAYWIELLILLPVMGFAIGLYTGLTVSNRHRTELRRLVERQAHEVHMLYLWHSPDAMGRQSWRNNQGGPDDAS